MVMALVLLKQAMAKQGHAVRVWFWDFSPKSSQLSFFHALSPHEGKLSVVTQAIDRIRERYGEEVIQYGRTT